MLLLIFIILTLIFLYRRRIIIAEDRRSKEDICLSYSNNEFKESIRNYLRTLEASQELQDYIANNPKLLNAIINFHKK